MLKDLRDSLILIAIVVFLLPVAVIALSHLLPLIVGLAFLVGVFVVIFRRGS